MPGKRERDAPRPGDPEAELLADAEYDAGLDELREALDGLRTSIRARFSAQAGRRAAAAPAELEWSSLFAAARRRLSTLGMRERSGEVDEFGMDEVVLARTRPILDFLYDQYWRVELHGIERLPHAGPCLLVANRSGVLPYDGLMLAHALHRRDPGSPTLRFTVADWLVTLPFVQPFLARLGGVRACRENAQRLLASGQFVAVFPEGVKGAAKVFRDRYRLQRFGRGGVVRLALEAGVPLHPVGVVGAEEAHPVLAKLHAPAEFLGLPFVPVTPTFPLLGPLGLVPLPSKWVIRVGDALPIEQLDRDAAGDDLLVSRLTEDLRDEVATLLEIGLRDRESVWG